MLKLILFWSLACLFSVDSDYYEGRIHHGRPSQFDQFRHHHAEDTPVHYDVKPGSREFGLPRYRSRYESVVHGPMDQKQLKPERLGRRDRTVAGKYGNDLNAQFLSSGEYQDLHKSEFLSAADASFRTFLSKQLFPEQSSGRKKSLARKGGQDTVASPSQNSPDFSRPLQVKTEKINEKLTEMEAKAKRQNQRRLVDESKVDKQDNKIFTTQRNEKNPADSKRSGHGEEKQSNKFKGKRLWSEHENERKSAESRQPNLPPTRLQSPENMLRDDGNFEMHPLFEGHRQSGHLTSNDRTGDGKLLSQSDKTNPSNEFHRDLDDHEPKQRMQDNLRKPEDFKKSINGNKDKETWMNFKFVVGDSGTLKIELSSPDKSGTIKAHGAKRPSEQSSGVVEPEFETDNWKSQDDFGENSSPSMHRSSRTRRHTQSGSDFHDGDAPANVIHFLPNKPPSARITPTSSHAQHRTAILDSIAIPVSVNVDDTMYSGCPDYYCPNTCPDGLTKLDSKSGCPTCDCCQPLLKCDKFCEFGYDADKDGCPACACLPQL